MQPRSGSLSGPLPTFDVTLAAPQLRPPKEPSRMTMQAQSTANDSQQTDSQGKRLLAIAAELGVFRTPGGDVYARFLVNGKEQTHPLRSKFVKGYLVTAY